MRHRLILAGLILTSLSGCSGMNAPKIDLSGMALPRFELFRYGVPETSVATTPYTLTAVQLADVKAQFSAEFEDGRTLEFGPVSARRQASGDLVICGLVNINEASGSASGMTLFDGSGKPNTSDGTLAFKARRVAGANAKAIDIYSACRDAGVL